MGVRHIGPLYSIYFQFHIVSEISIFRHNMTVCLVLIKYSGQFSAYHYSLPENKLFASVNFLILKKENLYTHKCVF